MNNVSFPSKVDLLRWKEHPFYIKRDDLLDPYLSGNKLRKLYYLLDKELKHYRQIVSYGGLQSNAMLSMASIAQSKKIPFVYYVRYRTKLDELVQSNYTLAAAMGMTVIELEAENDEALGAKVRTLCDTSTLFIAQGGAGNDARIGVELLAQEIIEWKSSQGADDLIVATPSGTGTTALWLQERLGAEALVLTTAVVGNRAYLQEQMMRQAPQKKLPLILETEKKYPFAKPHRDLYTVYEDFLALGIEFDLIYAPVMLKALEENKTVWKGKTLLYVHSGGVLGNTSQKARYRKLV